MRGSLAQEVLLVSACKINVNSWNAFCMLLEMLALIPKWPWANKSSRLGCGTIFIVFYYLYLFQVTWHKIKQGGHANFFRMFSPQDDLMTPFQKNQYYFIIKCMLYIKLIYADDLGSLFHIPSLHLIWDIDENGIFHKGNSVIGLLKEINI